MTAPILLALIGSVVMVFYWMLCRQRSLVVQSKAVEMLKDFYADETQNEKAKHIAHSNYKLAQRWWYFPILVVIVPVMVPVIMLFDRQGLTPDGGNGQKVKEIMDCLVMIYVTRNPITATLCMTSIIIATLPAILLGVLLNRLRTVPSFGYLTIVAMAKVLNKRSAAEAKAH